MKLGELDLKKPEYNDEIELYIEGDVNDGDYINETTVISVEEFLELLPIIKKLKIDEDSYDWKEREDILTEDEIELIEEFIPFSQDDEIHTITLIEAYYLSSKDSIRYEINF